MREPSLQGSLRIALTVHPPGHPSFRSPGSGDRGLLRKPKGAPGPVARMVGYCNPSAFPATLRKASAYWSMTQGS